MSPLNISRPGGIKAAPLPEGIPLERDYQKVIESITFKEMERFSDEFLSATKTILKDYMHKWVADPLHQWSRQWEYPFVYSRIEGAAERNHSLNILDAGSGVTFFPFYLNKITGSKIQCCDYDNSLVNLYEGINAGRNEKIEFRCADLRSLPYGGQSFDIVYCISVLEHTHEYEKIIEEFDRILRPGGTLLVTIDVSLDGTRDIDLDRGNRLLAALVKRFDADRGLSLDLHSQVSLPGILTTLTAPADLLPWKRPSVSSHIKSLVRTRRLRSWPPPLSVFCLELKKRLK